jgi:hypothetical protein
MYTRALQGYEGALGPKGVTTYILALNTTWGLGSLFDRQGHAAKAREMYSAALAGYKKAVGPKHACCQALRELLSALDDPKDITRDSASKSNGMGYSKSSDLR